LGLSRTHEPLEGFDAVSDIRVPPQAQAFHPLAVAVSWRDTWPIHPACELVPPTPADELPALGEDIVKTGRLTAEIVLWQADPKSPLQLLDGRSRLDALEMVVSKPVEIGPPSLTCGDFLAFNRVIVLDGRSVDPYAYVISANLRRRDLTLEQRQDALIKLIARAPKKSDRQIAKEAGVDHKTIASARAKGEDVGSIPHVPMRIDTRGRKQPAKKAGKRSEKAADPQVSDEMLRRRKTLDEQQDVLDWLDTAPTDAVLRVMTELVERIADRFLNPAGRKQLIITLQKALSRLAPASGRAASPEKPASDPDADLDLPPFLRREAAA